MEAMAARRRGRAVKTSAPFGRPIADSRPVVGAAARTPMAKTEAAATAMAQRSAVFSLLRR